MKKVIGIRREDKNIWERRVPIIPDHVKYLNETHGIETIIQPFDRRAFSDTEFIEAGATVKEDLSECPVVFAVKESTFTNDALIEDALACGLEQKCVVISNGTNCPGTPLGDCSDTFLHAFHNADIVISKGQGNFETLSETKKEIFFLLTVKCQVVGRYLNRLTGVRMEKLLGNGEMVVYRKRCIQ